MSKCLYKVFLANSNRAQSGWYISRVVYLLKLNSILLAFAISWGVVEAQEELNQQERQDVERAQSDAYRVEKQEEREKRKRLEEKRWRAKTSPHGSLEKRKALKKPKKSKQCFPIRVIRLKGDPSLSARARRNLVADLSGKCLGLKEIDYLVRSTTNYYIEQGYITTRAYIPQQDLRDGSLDIQIVPGYIEAIEFVNDNGYKSEIITAFPGLIGQRLNLRQIEQGLEQINRLQSNEARMSLLPGKKVGQSRIMIEKQTSKPWQTTVGFSSSGSESRGRLGVNGSLSLDNILLINDSWSISAQSSLLNLFGQNRNYSNSYTISGSIPLGYWTFSYFTSTSRWKQFIPGQVVDFIENEGEVQVHDFSIERIVYRTRNSKLTFSGNTTFKESKQFTQGIKRDVAGYNTRTTKLNAAYSHAIFGGSFSASFGYRFGRLRGGGDANTSVRDRTLSAINFWLIESRLSYYYPFSFFGQQFNAITSFDQQHTTDILHSVEQFSVGGLYTVRGFKNQALAADVGYVIRNELGWYILGNQGDVHQYFWGNPMVFMAYDFGITASNGISSSVGSLHGMAWGFKSYGRHGNVSITISRSLGYPDNFEPETAIWLSASFKL